MIHHLSDGRGHINSLTNDCSITTISKDATTWGAPVKGIKNEENQAYHQAC